MNTDKELTTEQEKIIDSVSDTIDKMGIIFRKKLNTDDELAEMQILLHNVCEYHYERGKKEANEWISVKDSPPPYDTPVMVWCEIYGRYIGTLVEIHKSGYGNWHDGKVLGVLPPIFWQPLPAPPQQGKEEENGN